MSTPITPPRINPGKRAIVAGRTGSGKSTLANWLLTRSPSNWVILNPKHTAAYSELPDSIVLKSMAMPGVEKALQKHRFVIVNVDSREADPDLMDAFVMTLHENWRNVGLCCDELYTLHKNGRAGAGLLGWLTRGRELKQSFLGLTQRPAWLSQFLFSEADYISRMALTLSQDKKRMMEMTGREEFMANIPERYWLWYDASKSNPPVYFQPVPVGTISP